MRGKAVGQVKTSRRETNDATTWRRCSIFGGRLGFSRVATLLTSSVLSLTVGVAAYWLFEPSLRRESSPPSFRVQSRSMEPTYHGPGFVSVCPSCSETFMTSLDVRSAPLVASDSLAISDESRSHNADSQEARAFRESARFLTCPYCGQPEVPASSATFRDGEALLARRSADPRQERYRAFVFRAHDGTMTLKRLIGFPGERVSIHNGDVWIDGRADWRKLREIWSTSVEIRTVRRVEGADRVFLQHVTPVRHAPSGTGCEGEVVEYLPTGISNESRIASFNGVNVSSPELTRDFLCVYEHRDSFDSSSAPADATLRQIATLVQRPDAAFLLRYDPSLGAVESRRLPLDSGAAPFEELTLADFEDAPLVEGEVLAAGCVERDFSTLDTSRPEPSSPVVRRVEVVSADGWITLSVDGAELYRVSTGDATSSSARAIAAPFVALARKDQILGFRLFRDVHYGSTPTSSRVLRAGEYYVLGDNSPASVDSRFEEFGVVKLEERYLVPARREGDGRPE